MIVSHQLNTCDYHTAVALGIFDGVHLGHQAVLSHIIRTDLPDLVSTVLTFSFSSFLPTGKAGGKKLQDEASFLRFAEALGIEQVIIHPFDLIRNLSPEEFVDQILDKALHARIVSCGLNYRFGKHAAGDYSLLCDLCSKRGIQVIGADPVLYDGDVVSSTRIRDMLLNGNAKGAAEMLGRPFSFCLPVMTGNRLGRTIGFPTTNQVFPSNLIVPKFGVYVSSVTVDDVRYHGITNIGVKPTVETDIAPLAETHIVGFSGDLYGKTIQVELLRFVRPEQKFSSLDELMLQIRKDLAEVDKSV